jgi:DNA-binding XRE family transcriptional regulator
MKRSTPVVADPEPRQPPGRVAKRRAGRPGGADLQVREAELFRQTRAALGLNPEDLAAVFGTHRRTIFRWERNERSIPPYLWLTLALMLISAGRRDRRPSALARALALPLPKDAQDWLGRPRRQRTAKDHFQPCR